MKKKKGQKEVGEGKPTRADIHHGSATQGGSDFGQGSLQLGNKTVKQGSESNDGANYDSETGWNNEALRSEDIKKPRKDRRTPKNK
jgi:hypothetical protein